MGEDLEIEMILGESHGSRQPNWLAFIGLTVLALGALVMVFGNNPTAESSAEEPLVTTPESVPDTVPIPEENAGDAAVVEAAGTIQGQQGQAGSRFPANASDSLDRLVVTFSGSSRIISLDVSTGKRLEFFAPEELANEDPIAFDKNVAVVGSSRAWARGLNPGDLWVDLGAADAIRPSTKPGRVWLQTENVKTSPTDAELLWTEVDLTGTTHRTMFRNAPLQFHTPELVLGFSGIFRLTDAEFNSWRLLSDFSAPVAVGLNDLITRECNARLECDRAWFNVNTGERLEGLYSDLADNVSAEGDAKLSPDGRFTMTEDSAGGIVVTSVVSKQILQNSCEWDGPTAWTTNSELLACTIGRKIQIFSSETGEAFGLSLTAVEIGSARIVFVPISAVSADIGDSE